MPTMSPTTRRVVQAVLYEIVAVAFVGPAMALVFGRPVVSTLALATFMSAVALGWNYVFNLLFERWEAGQATKTSCGPIHKRPPGRSPLSSKPRAMSPRRLAGSVFAEHSSIGTSNTTGSRSLACAQSRSPEPAGSGAG